MPLIHQMEGYSKTEIHIFEDEDDDEDELNVQKTKVKYTVLKEEDFIDRAVSPRIESRLGCQCELQTGSGAIEITIPDQTQFLGE